MGIIAAQLAVARGITVVGTVGAHDVDRLTALGAKAVRYGDGWADRVRAAAPQGVDYVFDASGAGVLANSVALTGDSAHVVTIADMSAARHGVRFSAGGGDSGGESLTELVALAADGRLTVPVWRTYPLAEAARAHADLEAHLNRGKAVLLPCCPEGVRSRPRGASREPVTLEDPVGGGLPPPAVPAGQLGAYLGHLRGEPSVKLPGLWPHSCPGATRRAPGNELCTVVAIAQGMDHALQDPERA